MMESGGIVGAGPLVTMGVFLVGLSVFLFIKKTIKQRQFNKQKAAEAHEQKIKMRNIEKALRKASEQNLKDASITLAQAGIFLSEEHLEFPEVFWGIRDVTLIALTLKTCAKIFNRNRTYVGEWVIYSEYAIKLSRLAKTDIDKAFGIMGIFCLLDKEGAKALICLLTPDIQTSGTMYQEIVHL